MQVTKTSFLSKIRVESAKVYEECKSKEKINQKNKKQKKKTNKVAEEYIT